MTFRISLIPENIPTIEAILIPTRQHKKFMLAPFDTSAASTKFWSAVTSSFHLIHGHYRQTTEGPITLFCPRVCHFRYQLPKLPPTLPMHVGSQLFPNVAYPIPLPIRIHLRHAHVFSSYCGTENACTLTHPSSLFYQITWWGPYFSEQDANSPIPIRWIVAKGVDPPSDVVTTRCRDQIRYVINAWRKNGILDPAVKSVTILVIPKTEHPSHSQWVIKEPPTVVIGSHALTHHPNMLLESMGALLATNQIPDWYPAVQSHLSRLENK